MLTAVEADRCLLAGWSGGGPHALACGARLGSTAGTLVISGVAPYGLSDLDWMAGMGEDNVAEFGAALLGEPTLRPLLEEVREHLKDTDSAGIIAELDSLLPDVDRAVLTAEFGEDTAASFAEGLRHGVDGWVDDDLAFTEPWGFNFDEISGPVVIWQGSLDLMVPFAHGEALASRIPGASVHLEEGEGHLSVGIGALERMLDELVAAANDRLSPRPEFQSLLLKMFKKKRKTFRASRKIDAAMSGAEASVAAAPQPLEVEHRETGEDDQALAIE